MKKVKTHELKSNIAPFNDVLTGAKRAEVRHDDRGFKVGDNLHLSEFMTGDGFTGRSMTVKITHIQKDYGLPHALVVLSFRVLRKAY